MGFAGNANFFTIIQTKKSAIMQKKITSPILAAIAGVVLAITFSAFNTIPAKHTGEKFSNVYFQYGGTDESSTNLTTPANWIKLASLPMSNPCSGLPNIVCVSHLDATTLAAQAGANDVAKFITYLNANGPKTYVDATHDFQKQ
jgi:hypothetical protein